MEIKKLKDFFRGWIIGNFEPSLFKTKDFEVGIIVHKKGEKWPVHYHKLAIEYNVLIFGKMKINGVDISAGDIFIIEKNEISDSQFIEDCTILCLKVPSVIGDKYEVL